MRVSSVSFGSVADNAAKAVAVLSELKFPTPPPRPHYKVPEVPLSAPRQNKGGLGQPVGWELVNTTLSGPIQKK